MGVVVGVGALLAQTVVAVVLGVRRPRHPVTAVLAIMTAASWLLAVAPERAINALWGLSVLPLSALLVAFPDGPRGPRWRAAFTYLIGAIATVTVLAVAFPLPASPFLFYLSAVLAASVIPVAAVAVVSLVRLWRRSAGERRSRIGLVVGAGAVLVVPAVVFPPITAGLRAMGVDVLSGPVQAVADAWFMAMGYHLLPLAIGVSMLLEPVGRRLAWVEQAWPWVFGAASAVLVGGTAVQMTVALGADAGDPISVAVASIAVAGCVAWVMALVQRSLAPVAPAADRAAQALRDLAVRLESVPAADEVPALITRSVGEVLDLAGVAVEARVDGRSERLAAWGQSEGPTVIRPLQHVGETVGSLALVQHRDGVPIDPSMLDPLMPSLSALVAADGLERRLGLANQRIRDIRESERIRLRTDLHDELSPSLSGVRLTLHAARVLLPDTPAGAAGGTAVGVAGDAEQVSRLLVRADAELSRAGSLIRGILEDLRPDALASQGLVAAVHDRAGDFNRPGSFEVTVVAEPGLPHLAPSVEVAALRIANEAICNAARHSRGRACRVGLAGVAAGLALTVTDDGIGVPDDHRPGVGLESMAARAAAAGGHLSIRGGQPRGTVVDVWLPGETRSASTDGDGSPVRVFAGARSELAVAQESGSPR